MTEGSVSAQVGARKEEYKPRLIFWEVTKGCNLRCIHCRATATELMSPTDLPTGKALDIITQIAAFANPILVLSGGEPLYRPDIFQLAEYATSSGLRVALATNGTLVTKDVGAEGKGRRHQARLDLARWLRCSNSRYVSWHSGCLRRRDLWHAQPAGAKACRCRSTLRLRATMRNQLPAVLDLARSLGKPTPCTLFCFVPVGCGVDIATGSKWWLRMNMSAMLNWFYDQSLEGGIELKATCAPHYFRVVRQLSRCRPFGGNRTYRAGDQASPRNRPNRDDHVTGSTGISLKPGGGPSVGHSGHPGGNPGDLNATTKGCLAGTGVCFLSRTKERFFPAATCRPWRATCASKASPRFGTTRMFSLNSGTTTI